MPRFKFGGMFAVSSKMYFTITVIAVEETAFPFLSIKTFWSKVIAASSFSQRFLISPVDCNDYDPKWDLYGISPLKTGPYCCLMVEIPALRIRQTGYQNQQKFFSPFAVDKPVEKQIFFELPHCFLT